MRSFLMNGERKRVLKSAKTAAANDRKNFGYV